MQLTSNALAGTLAGDHHLVRHAVRPVRHLPRQFGVDDGGPRARDGECRGPQHPGDGDLHGIHDGTLARRTGSTASSRPMAKAVADEWNDMADSGPAQRRRAGAAQHLCRRDPGLFRGRAEPRCCSSGFWWRSTASPTARQQRLSMAQDVVSLGQWVLVIGAGPAAAGDGGRRPCALSRCRAAVALAGDDRWPSRSRCS